MSYTSPPLVSVTIWERA